MDRRLFMTRKTWSLILFFLVLLLPDAPAFARISGVFSGRFVVIDRRAARPASTVCESGILPCTVPVRRAIVSVSVRNAETNRDPGSDCCEVAPQTFWKQTDDNGMFDTSWEDVTRDEFPVGLRITVHWFSTTGNIISTTQDDAPSNIAFVIEGPSGERLSESISIAGVQATNPTSLPYAFGSFPAHCPVVGPSEGSYDRPIGEDQNPRFRFSLRRRAIR
jgi:hypothetical protein